MRQKSMWQRPISDESLWVTGICLVDLATTLYWVAQGHGANPRHPERLVADRTLPHRLLPHGLLLLILRTTIFCSR